MAKNKRTNSADRQDLLDAWKTSEQVAMHFNNLLIGFRLKAIGGVAIGAAIVVGLKLCDSDSNHRIIGVFFAALAFIWMLIWAVDFFYYYRLLAGAVDELLRIEEKHGDIFLSHSIEHRVHHGTRKSDISGLHRTSGPPNLPSWPIWLFYVVPMLLLIIASIVILCGSCCSAASCGAQLTPGAAIALSNSAA